MAHAYFTTGESEKGIVEAESFAEQKFGVVGRSNPDLVVLQHGLFSVEDARKLVDVAVAAPVGEHKVIIVSATRIFHEAQNALLKLFEEPPRDVTLILVLPSEGVLLSTLRSRLALLPEHHDSKTEVSLLAQEFLAANSAEREKLIAKFIDRSKSDKDEEKQRARSDAVRLAEDLMRTASRKGELKDSELRLFVDDLMHFLPLLHTRSAPLKLIFEHLLLVIPKGLTRPHV